MSGFAILGFALALALPNAGRAGTLSGSVSPLTDSSSADLSALGNVDWAIWGQGISTSLAPTNSMSGGSGISNLTDYSNGSPLRGLGQFGSYNEALFSWSNGSPTASASNVASGIQLESGYNGSSQQAVGEGFSFTVAAGTTLEELLLYSTVNYGTAQVTASLSDSSASPITLNLGPVNYCCNGNTPYVTAIEFAADSPNQTLDVSLTLSYDGSGDGTGNAALQGVAVSDVAPEPGSFLLGGAGLAGLLFAAKRKRDKVNQAA